MKVYFCDFCGAKLKDTDQVCSIDFLLEAKFGGFGQQTHFEGCSQCIDEVNDAVRKLCGKCKK